MYEESAGYMQVARKLITQAHCRSTDDRTWSVPVGMVNKKMALLRAVMFPSQEELEL
jgi:hypothetical protein